MKEIAEVAKTAAATPRRPPGSVGRDTDRDSTGVDVIAKVDAILSVLEQRGETSAVDIAELTGEPLSSICRAAAEPDRCRLGRPWLPAGRLPARSAAAGSECRLEDQLDIREVALPTLRQLLSDIGVTAFLCVRRDARAVCVERLEGQSVRSLAMQLGSSLPLYAGAAPRALLAFLPIDEQQAVLATAELAGDPARPDQATIENAEHITAHRTQLADALLRSAANLSDTLP